MRSSSVPVSVVVTARRPATALDDSLSSLRSQTCLHWEAVIVDDGSHADTGSTARRFIAQDDRLRLARAEGAGPSAARNVGIAQARHGWLLFLDAGDTIKQRHLETMTERVAEEELDAAHCGWVSLAPDGRSLACRAVPDQRDLFPLLARTPAFPLNACIVKRELVEMVGCFDSSLQACEDWDLWQRVARAVASFGRVDEALAQCRVEPHSARKGLAETMREGLGVIERGHAPDPRLSRPSPRHSNGASSDELPRARLEYVARLAASALALEQDHRPLLEGLPAAPVADLDASAIAEIFFDVVLSGDGERPGGSVSLWKKRSAQIIGLLADLESVSPSCGLSPRVLACLERLLVDHSPALPLTVGSTYGLAVDAAVPLDDLVLPRGIKRVRCAVSFGRERLGVIALPACSDVVSTYVVQDAIAAAFAWEIMFLHFRATIYPELITVRSGDKVTLQRGALALASGLEPDPDKLWVDAHDRAGWTVFLQEVWGRPSWPVERFYDPDDKSDDQAGHRIQADGSVVTVEVAEEPPEIHANGSHIEVIAQVGGVPVGAVEVALNRGVASPQTVRAAITTAGGMELCRAVVRQALLGRGATTPSLRRALLESARNASATTRSDRFAGFVVLGRRHRAIDSSANARRAMLPEGAAQEALEMAVTVGEVAHDQRAHGKGPALYAPDLMTPISPSPSPGAVVVMPPEEPTRPYDRGHFESLFASRTDPWTYSTAYEQKKYDLTLSVLPHRRWRRVIEIGCAEGHFTEMLAGRVERLIAADISWIALQRAAQRCREHDNITFQRLDLGRDELPGGLDLVVCSETLYFVGDRTRLSDVAHTIAGALRPGGYLAMAHANTLADAPEGPGFDWAVPFGAKTIGEVFGNVRSLSLAKELRTPLYRIHLFRRSPIGLRIRRAPSITELPEVPSPIPPHVAQHASWQGGRPAPPPSTGTTRLPILMYHRVAPSGPDATQRYRVNPNRFEDQLDYLAEAGYKTVSLHDWLRAVEQKRALPGPAVALTFDDATTDFCQHAWPLLRAHGFSATLFVPTAYVGRLNEWEVLPEETLDIVTWDDLRRLCAEGCDIGSHSVTHPYLTALAPDEVAREALASRRVVRSQLPRAVDAFAYPYGDWDPTVEHLVGASGYILGLTTRPGRATFQSSLLALPRIEVRGDATFEDFVRAMGS